MAYGKTFIQNTTCVLMAALTSYYFSSVIGEFYCGTIENCSAGLASVDFSSIIGLLLGYFFFIPSILISFGSGGKKWWIILLILPILIWAIYAGIRLMQLAPIVLSAAAGIILGVLVNKALTRLAPSFMRKIS